MKTDFSINVQVNLGVTPELMQLANAFLSHKPTIAQGREALLDANAQVEEKPKNATTVKPQQPNSAKEQPGNTDTESQAPQGEATTEQAPSGDQTQAPKELTEEDVRAAMHQTRQRIEGEDYKEHTDSEAYKKYHKALTAQFKNIAALLGADKPSALPVEKRESFIKECDDLVVLEDGTIGSKCPF